MLKPVGSPKGLAWILGIRLEVLQRLAQAAVRHYRPFRIKTGAKIRTIDNPDTQLKSVQRKIDLRLLKKVDFGDCVHGGVKGRSVQTNVRPHLGKRCVVRIDISDFFPSISDRHVYAVWARLGFSKPVASLLTALTTYRNRLPQGAPTSTSLANLVLVECDETLRAEAAKQGLSYTRFVDDMVFSGDDPRAEIQAANRALRCSGFRVSRRKLRIEGPSRPHEVTGLTVNSKKAPSVPRYRRDQVRAAIKQIKSLGPEDRTYEQENRSLEGRIRWVGITNPGAERRLRRLLAGEVSKAAS